MRGARARSTELRHVLKSRTTVLGTLVGSMPYEYVPCGRSSTRHVVVRNTRYRIPRTIVLFFGPGSLRYERRIPHDRNRDERRLPSRAIDLLRRRLNSESGASKMFGTNVCGLRSISGNQVLCTCTMIRCPFWNAIALRVQVDRVLLDLVRRDRLRLLEALAEPAARTRRSPP